MEYVVKEFLYIVIPGALLIASIMYFFETRNDKINEKQFNKDKFLKHHETN